MSCKNALKEFGYLRRRNNPNMLNKLIGRLPFDMKRKWYDIADDGDLMNQKLTASKNRKEKKQPLCITANHARLSGCITFWFVPDISECKQREISIEDTASFVKKRARSTSNLVWRHSQSEIHSKPGKISKTKTLQSNTSSGKGYLFGTTREPKRDAGSTVSQHKCPL
ncbi:hypothetical protein P5673_026511 [Acropora cervicornis]|uniref:Uncharacterized protein n=1 Tax=Acropora cervicornis TaxID=6130 RepID=A0AAD9Q143_ACRCE|nr:hypothetical protein P5673_026511 [Acropora cervicornis]